MGYQSRYMYSLLSDNNVIIYTHAKKKIIDISAVKTQKPCQHAMSPLCNCVSLSVNLTGMHHLLGLLQLSCFRPHCGLQPYLICLISSLSFLLIALASQFIVIFTSNDLASAVVTFSIAHHFTVASSGLICATSDLLGLSQDTPQPGELQSFYKADKQTLTTQLAVIEEKCGLKNNMK